MLISKLKAKLPIEKVYLNLLPTQLKKQLRLLKELSNYNLVLMMGT